MGVWEDAAAELLRMPPEELRRRMGWDEKPPFPEVEENPEPGTESTPTDGGTR